MSTQGQRTIITGQTNQEFPLPTCTPNLMPFHIKHTGPAAVSMFLRVEKVLKADEEGKKEQNENQEAVAVDVEMKSDLIEAPPPNPVQVQVQPTDSDVKNDTYDDKRFVSSFRGRTIHGLTVDVPSGYTGLLLQGDPQPTVTHSADRVTRVLNADVKSGLEGEEERDEEVADSGVTGGRNTRSRSKGIVASEKGKGKAKQDEPIKTAPKPKGRLARTAAPKQPEVITVDNEDEEMADPVPPVPVSAIEVPDHPLKSTNDNTNAPDDSSRDNDLALDIDTPLRKLIPQSTFSSITLWHADRAVDETRDEYYRTLTEWMALSHEIHRTAL